MFYVSSRLFSKVQFDEKYDTELWYQLVPSFKSIEKVNETNSIWKFWMTGEVFIADNLQNHAFSISKTSEFETQPSRLTIQTIASYLFIQQTDGQTIFTFLSPYQNALESLESLIASLYEPTESASLYDCLLTNQYDLSVRTVRYFDRKTGEEVQRTFAEPIQLSEAIRKYSSLVRSPGARKDLLSLSDISNTNNPSAGILSMVIDVQMNKISFFTTEMEELASVAEEKSRDTERKHIDYIFKLADRAFKGESLTTAKLVY